MTSLRQAQLRISGVVQGVSLRSYIRDQAQRLGIHGWVKNESNGTVSVLCQGDREQLDALIARCKAGSKSSRVEHIEIVWQEPKKRLEKFSIIH